MVLQGYFSIMGISVTNIKPNKNFRRVPSLPYRACRARLIKKQRAKKHNGSVMATLLWIKGQFYIEPSNTCSYECIVESRYQLLQLS